MHKIFLNLLPPELKNIASDLYDIILERSLTRTYQNLDEQTKAKMADIFNSGADGEKNAFLNEYLKDLPAIMAEEAKKLAEEIKTKE